MEMSDLREAGRLRARCANCNWGLSLKKFKARQRCPRCDSSQISLRPSIKLERKALNGRISFMRPYALIQLTVGMPKRDVRRRSLLAQLLVIKCPNGQIPWKVRGTTCPWSSGVVTVSNIIEEYHLGMAAAEHHNLCHQLEHGWVGISEERLRAEKNPSRRQQIIDAIIKCRINSI